MAQYESEHTRFMRDYLAQHPEALEEQRTGRALWWDKTPEEVEASRQRQAATRVPQKPYYYQPE